MLLKLRLLHTIKMVDWLLAQALKIALSSVVTWLQKKGYFDAAEALGAKEAHEVIQDIKNTQVVADYPTGRNGQYAAPEQIPNNISAYTITPHN